MHGAWLAVALLAHLGAGSSPQPAEPSKRLFVFALWDGRDAVAHGALDNARTTSYHHPGWRTRFYLDVTLPARMAEALGRAGAEVVNMSRREARFPPFLWPLLAEDDPSVQRFCYRTPTTRPSTRDAVLVDEWVRSGQPFHSIRDSPEHDTDLHPGLWCARRGFLTNRTGRPMAPWLSKFGRLGTAAPSHRAFLRQTLWPLVTGHTFHHDAINCTTARRHPIPIPRHRDDHVGQQWTSQGPVRVGFKFPPTCYEPRWLHVITQFHLPPRPRRRRELVQTLRSYAVHFLVREVHLLGENDAGLEEVLGDLDPAARARVKFIHIPTQLTYKMAFDYASTALEGAICIVLNSDIMLGVGFHLLHNGFTARLRPYVFGLSRRPSPHCMVETDVCLKYTGSHDAFLFVSPVPRFATRNLDFRQNLWGAENVVLHELARAFRIANPCGLLLVHHYHCTQDRTWMRGNTSVRVERVTAPKKVPSTFAFPWDVPSPGLAHRRRPTPA